MFNLQIKIKALSAAAVFSECLHLLVLLSYNHAIAKKAHDQLTIFADNECLPVVEQLLTGPKKI